MVVYFINHNTFKKSPVIVKISNKKLDNLGHQIFS